MPEKFWRFLAQRAPRRLVYYCAIRLMAHATKPPHEKQEVPSLLAMEALERWG